MISQCLIDYLVFAQTTRWRHSTRMRTVSNVAQFFVVVVDVSRELDPATGASVTVDNYCIRPRFVNLSHGAMNDVLFVAIFLVLSIFY